MMDQSIKKKNKVLIIGGGPISLEYAAICISIDMNISMVSRSLPDDCNKDNIDFIEGDLFAIPINSLKKYSHIIIAVQPRFTFNILKYLLENTRALLMVEKPVCLTSNEFAEISDTVFNKRVYVAFNRRSFSSTQEAKKRIEGKPILLLEVCFTEMKDRMRGSKDEIDLWGMCNTIHLIDMAFYLAEIPNEIEVTKTSSEDVISYYVTGKISKGNVNMNAHWGAAGNWGITITTPDEKLYFDPLETLRIQNSGSFSKNEITIEKTSDDIFKDGFLLQTKNFINGKRSEFIRYNDYHNLIFTIEKIFK
ncbi:hypothetical protein OAU65_00990 [Gammaproteobacteria bacterium]|nr:hypothetical protein [Gammaproteobacteria bacterium]